MYSPEVYKKVSEIYEERRRNAMTELDRRIEHAKRAIPELEQIDLKLSSTGARIMQALKKPNRERAFEDVRRETDELAARREDLLAANGFPRDYCSPQFLCALCGDTGYVDGKCCVCMKDALYRAQAELSGLGGLLGRQTFGNFDLSCYADREEAQSAKDAAEKIARGEWKTGKNMLIMGGTGMGKTHLSTAVADGVMRGGGSVVYESAPHILDDFRYEQFGRGWNDRSPVRTDRYFTTDLLIIDDLGSEIPGSFATSVLYNLLNTRLNEQKSMLFNTNYSQKELIENYDRRIVSRILSAFSIFFLEGTDFRMKKLDH